MKTENIHDKVLSPGERMGESVILKIIINKKAWYQSRSGALNTERRIRTMMYTEHLLLMWIAKPMSSFRDPGREH